VALFIDTSALLAVMNADDEYHGAALDAWVGAVERDNRLVSTSYVLVETTALLQNRMGIEAVAIFNNDILPVIEICWIDEALHATAMAILLAAGRPRLSLVDCASFVCMRQWGIKKVFTFDPHFKEQGFECLPPVR